MHLKPEHPSSQLTKLLQREKDDTSKLRAGTRGGWDRFNWNDVRHMTFKDRNCYLGYSTKIGFLDKGGKWKKSGWVNRIKRSKDGTGMVMSEGLSALSIRTKEDAQREDRRRMKLALEGKTDEIFSANSKI
jgi:hypothetical protein